VGIIKQKILFELCYEKYPETKITKREVRSIIEDNEEGLFAYLDLGMSRSDQSKFGRMFEKYVGRILSDIRLMKVGESNRASRQDYMFTKESCRMSKKLGNFGNIGNQTHPQQYIEKDMNILSSMSQVAKDTEVTTNHIDVKKHKPQHLVVKEEHIQDTEEKVLTEDETIDFIEDLKKNE